MSVLVPPHRHQRQHRDRRERRGLRDGPDAAARRETQSPEPAAARSGRRRVLERQVEHEVRQAQRGDRDQRRAGAARSSTARAGGRASSSTTTARACVHSHGTTNVRSSAKASSRGDGSRRACRRRRSPHRPGCRGRPGRPAARRWQSPAEPPSASASDGEGHRASQRGAAGNTRPMRSTRTSSSSGAVSHSVWVRRPTARPASNAHRGRSPPRGGASSSGVSRRSPSEVGACHHHAAEQRACAASASRQARHVAHRTHGQCTRTAGRRRAGRGAPHGALASSTRQAIGPSSPSARRTIP